VSGVYGNILDIHPINAIRKMSRETKVEGREPERNHALNKALR
jgi:hypothetical protein